MLQFSTYGNLINSLMLMLSFVIFEGFICVLGTNVTFVHVNISMTWMAARWYCRRRHTDLASVRNLAENWQLQVLVPTGQGVWIGLSRESWKWSDGTGSAFRFWMSGEPSKTRQNCAAANMTDSGRWQNFLCTEKKPSVCSAGTKRFCFGWLGLFWTVLVLFCSVIVGFGSVRKAALLRCASCWCLCCLVSLDVVSSL